MRSIDTLEVARRLQSDFSFDARQAKGLIFAVRELTAGQFVAHHAFDMKMQSGASELALFRQNMEARFEALEATIRSTSDRVVIRLGALAIVLCGLMFAMLKLTA